MASDEPLWPVGTEVIVRGDYETYRGRVVRGCCSEHVFVERPNALPGSRWQALYDTAKRIRERNDDGT